MGLSRRNALIGIGTVAAGAGVIGASGAFTSVEADRQISVSTEGDGSANIGFDINDTEGLTDTGDDDVIGFNFEGINLEATTTFGGALTITNNVADNYEVEVTAAPDDVTFEVDGDSLENTPQDLDTGEDLDVDIVIDTTGFTSEDPEFVDDETVTFLVTE